MRSAVRRLPSARGLAETLLALALAAGTGAREGAASADDAVARPDPGVEAEEEIRFVSRLDANQQATLLVLRVVDDATSAPIPGASVDVHLEKQHPGPGPVAPVASGRSGPDGWARIPVEGLLLGTAPWVYTTAEGFAPGAELETGAGKSEIRLRRGTDVTVEVRDFLDRPVAKARVGYHLGCGHTPDVRDVVSGPDGRAVLEGIDPDLGQVWVVAEGLASEYFELHGFRAGDAPRVLRHQPAAPIEGVVLSHDGKPVAGAAVGWRAFHRGPWTRTDAEGRFRLLGLAAAPGDHNLEVETTDPPVTPKEVPGVTARAPLPGFRRVIRLPAADSEDSAEEVPEGAERGETRVHVVVWERGAKKPAEKARIALVRVADGLTYVGTADEFGEMSVEAVPGAYVVLAGSVPGLEGAVFTLARATLDVVSEGPQLVRLEVERAPTAAVDATGLPEDVEARYATPVGSWQIPRDSDTPLVDLPLAPSGDAALVLVAEGIVKVLPLPKSPPPAGTRPLRLSWPPRARVRVAFEDPSGAAAQVRVALSTQRPEFDDLEPSEGTTLDADRTPGLSLWGEPSDPHFRRFMVRLPDPLPPDTLDLGTVRLVATVPSPLVLSPEGGPAAGTSVRVSRGAHVFEADLGPGGRIESPDEDVDGVLGDGAVLVAVPKEGGFGRYPLRTRLVGPPPWTVRWPRGVVEVRALDEEGKSLPEFVVAVDGEVRAGRGGILVVDGVPAGRHEVVVSAAGRRSRTWSFDLSDGASKALEGRLRPLEPAGK